jgi:DNA-binding NarL/FixJ family response regulator
MPRAELEVLIVDDDEIVCAWLRRSLAGTEFRVAGEAPSHAAALKLLKRRHIDLLLVDFRLKDKNGLEFIRGLRADERMTPAVIMTASGERGLSEAAREAGAQGTLVKSSNPDSLLAALRAVAAGETWFDPGHPSRANDASPLTRREREVLTLAARGLTNRETAEQLGLGEESVKTYLERAYAKLGVSRRAEAVAEAHRLGLLGN